MLARAEWKSLANDFRRRWRLGALLRREPVVDDQDNLLGVIRSARKCLAWHLAAFFFTQESR